ncbi:MAG: transaldolase family protein [Oligoflexales bacterium]
MNGLQTTIQHGVDIWNDSCDLDELQEAIQHGANGATSNPVIVTQVFNKQPDRWMPVLQKIIKNNPQAHETEIAWMLISEVGQTAAKLLEPIYQKTDHQKGFLSLQVSPHFYRSSDKMVKHALELNKLAPNLAIKLPATPEGLIAVEEVAAKGARVNVTAAFTVAQAIESANALERGYKRLGRQEPCWVSLLIGRTEDAIKQVVDKERLDISPTSLCWAGAAVFKESARIFREKNSQPKLLAAAYRHKLHWSELTGPDVVMTMGYRWWKQFHASKAPSSPTLFTPVPEIALDELKTIPRFLDFYEPDRLKIEQFKSLEPMSYTLKQFQEGTDQLIHTVRSQMLKDYEKK